MTTTAEVPATNATEETNYSAHPDYIKRKESEATHGPMIAKNLAAFIRTFHANDRNALEKFSSFLLNINDVLFSRLCCYKHPATPEDEEARSFIYPLVGYHHGRAVDDYAKSVTESVYQMCGVRSWYTGEPGLKYDQIHDSIARAFLEDPGWGRLDSLENIQRFNALLNCFEYPKGLPK